MFVATGYSLSWYYNQDQYFISCTENIVTNCSIVAIVNHYLFEREGNREGNTEVILLVLLSQCFMEGAK